MKKYVIAMLITLFIFTGCSKVDKTVEENKTDVPGAKQEEVQVGKEEKKDADQQPQELGKSRIANYPEASEGKFTNLSVKFTDTKEKVYKELGEPDEITTWQGSDLYIYDNLGIYIDPNEEKVTGLTAGLGYKTYGIEIGMTVDAIKNILGPPDFEGENFESGALVMEYEAGDYIVEISIKPESKQSIGVTLYSFNY